MSAVSSRRWLASAARFAGNHPATLVTAVALVIGYYGIGRASIWFDEAATWTAAIRPVGDLFALMEIKDRPFLPYYLFMHYWTLGGTSEVWLRLPSLLAAAGAAGLTARIGSYLYTPRAGLLAGLLLAVIPAWSRYAQEARPYAFVLLFAALATLALVRGWWVVYIAALLGIAASHPVALMIVVAHGVQAWRVRSSLRPWLISTAVAAVPIALFLGWVLAQPGGQQSWSKTPNLFNFVDSGQYVLWSAGAFAALAGVILAGAHRRHLHPIVVTWLVLPPVVLFVVGQLAHVWVHRYLLFCLPALALLAGAALGGRRIYVGLLAVAVIAVLGYPDQREIRSPGGHSTDFRAAVQEMKKVDGAAVLVAPSWQRVTLDYHKWDLGNVADVMRVERKYGAFSATEAPAAEASRRLAKYDQVWWLHYVDSSDRPVSLTGEDQAKLQVLEQEFKPVKTVDESGLRLTLYARAGGGD